jgi:CBS-domain-containing membrane protein
MRWREHQLRRIPIVDNDNQYCGIIAQADVATRVDQPKKPLKWSRKFRKPAESKRYYSPKERMIDKGDMKCLAKE